MRLIYNSSTGKIRDIFQGPSIFLDIQPVGLDELTLDIEDNTDISLSYVANATLTTRVAQATTLNKTTIIANGTDTINISNCPTGTFTATNTVSGETISGAIDGTDTFATTVAGSYNITITSWPYLDFTATITATEV